MRYYCEFYYKHHNNHNNHINNSKHIDRRCNETNERHEMEKKKSIIKIHLWLVQIWFVTNILQTFNSKIINLKHIKLKKIIIIILKYNQIIN
jgi:hypothetical protein